MIDIQTLIIWNGVALAVLGSLFLFYWFWQSRTGGLLWWCLPFVFGLLAAGASAGHDALPDVLAPRLAVVLIMLAYGAVWQAARVFNGHRGVLLPVVAVIAVWCLLPGIGAPGAPEAYVSSVVRGLVIGAFNGLAAYEFWRGRQEEPLPSRAALAAILGANAVFQVVSHLYAPVLPAPLGLGPTEAWAAIAYNLAVLLVALAVTILMVSLSRERVAEQYHQLALHDQLTGLLNRRAFDAAGAESQAPYALLVIDIDHFKKINDGFGHHVGDAVLVEAARAIERCIRRSDQAFRLGGEEFVCRLPHAALGQAEVVAERIRRAFEALIITLPEGEVHATLSVGVAACADGGRPQDELFADADAALYIAKQSGRNRVTLSTYARPAVDTATPARPQVGA
ncbi:MULTISPECIES: GGDEF domain-containing protein [unclassified Xanthobacter]|uniref:GGDEF domain-containing protein n=1 Tax=unclassified Xanthobacter TaxID=2623496 RepID=UPI001EDF6E12|nr:MULTISPECIES: GGDEF domain-containing protein [unclassified Xanthobacter]